MEKKWKQWYNFLGLQNHCRGWLQPCNSKMLAPCKKRYDKPRQHIKKQRHYFANRGVFSQRYDFSSILVWMWELAHEEGWALMNWHFWTAVLEKTLKNPWTAVRSNQSILKKSTLNIHWKDWCWSWSSNTLATWRKEPTHWKRPRCQERLKAGGERDNRGEDGWMVSLTQWTWVCRNWETVKDREAKPGML